MQKAEKYKKQPGRRNLPLANKIYGLRPQNALKK